MIITNTSTVRDIEWNGTTNIMIIKCGKPMKNNDIEIKLHLTEKQYREFINDNLQPKFALENVKMTLTLEQVV